MLIKVKLTRQENIDYYHSDLIEIDIEEYLKGVVPSEIGNALLPACKAQAIAARSFALYKYSKSGQLTDKSSSDQAFRVSRISSQYPNAQLAVEETKGQVLYYNGQLACAYYSSSNGGRIKSSQERWGGVRGYLISKDDPYDNGSGGGHGVGMSQNGAKNMAALNFSYQDILQFYYPNTEIREMYGVSKIEAVKSYALSKVGCGYVWGAVGQKLTEAELQELYRAHPNDVNLNLSRKWIGYSVFDCAGLVAQAMRQAGIKMSTGASSAWTKTKWEATGPIETLPKDKVCCLYRRKTSNPNKMQHTGVYLGDGTYVDARGTSSGVIGPNKLSEYPWTDWGIPAGLYDNSSNNKQEVIKVMYQATVIADSGSSVNMRAKASTAGAKLAAVPIGTVVDVTSNEGGWSAIVYEGKSGYMMSKYLKQKSGSENNKIWYVKIECANEAEAKAVAAVLAKAQATT